MTDVDPTLLDLALLDPELGELEGDVLLAAVRARIAETLLGLAGAPFESALQALPAPMRVVHALDAFRDVLATTPRDAAIDRRYVTEALESLMKIGLHLPALALADACGTHRAVPRTAIDASTAVATSMPTWNAALAAYLEARRGFHH